MTKRAPSEKQMLKLTDGSSKDGPLAALIAKAVEQGKLKADPAQAPAIASLDSILDRLATPSLGNKKSALGWLFGKRPAASDQSLRGLYLWGGVGRGKSMLMDMFYDLAPTQPKRRIHFHAFMQDIHARIHVWRQGRKTAKERSADPIPPLVEELAKEAHLLCFDEFAVTDVADAMLLARLFTGLFANGVTVVATSNVVPDNLYKDGLNRSFFLPFIELVKTRMDVLELASATDYRMEMLTNGDVYMCGNDSAEKFETLWTQMTKGLVVEAASIEVAGRETVFDLSSGGLVRAGFSQLCQTALGAGDYLALAERFHTVFLGGVPVMQWEDRNAVKRFITLIDTMYDQGLQLIVQAEERPAKLYAVETGTEAFEFQRTISRLREMQSDEWLKRQ